MYIEEAGVQSGFEKKVCPTKPPEKKKRVPPNPPNKNRVPPKPPQRIRAPPKQSDQGGGGVNPPEPNSPVTKLGQRNGFTNPLACVHP